jgi:hypothetical protein
MVSEDIVAMLEKKEEQLFRRKYPHHKSKLQKEFNGIGSHTEKMIKLCNRMLSKYKNEHGVESLKLVNEFYYP